MKLPKKEKQPRWKREQKEKKFEKQKRTIGSWLVLASVILFLGVSLKGFKIYRQSIWRGNERINLVFFCRPLAVFSYSSSEESLIALLIPDKVEIPVVGGYGSYKIESIPKLEEMEKKKLLSESIRQTLGIPIDAYLMFPDCQIKESTDLKKEFLKRVSLSFLGKGETNLSKWDLAWLFMKARSVGPGKLESFNLEPMGILKEKVLTDQSRAWEISPAKFDFSFKNLFRDEKAKSEGLSIEVLNATHTPGLAEAAARVLTNMGLEVAGVRNASEERSKSVICGSERLRKTYTVGKLGKIFGCQFCQELPERADLSLILGQDYAEKLLGQ